MHAVAFQPLLLSTLILRRAHTHTHTEMQSCVLEKEVESEGGGGAREREREREILHRLHCPHTTNIMLTM